MNKLNAPQKSIVMMLVVILAFLSFVTMACDKNPCANGSVCGITAPAGEVQNMVTDWAKDTCPKRADGTCKTMGE